MSIEILTLGTGIILIAGIKALQAQKLKSAKVPVKVKK